MTIMNNTLEMTDHMQERFYERYPKAASNQKNIWGLIDLLSTPGKYTTINIQGDIHTRSTKYEISYLVKDKNERVSQIKKMQEFHAVIDIKLNIIKTFVPVLKVDNSKYQTYDFQQVIKYKNEQNKLLLAENNNIKNKYEKSSDEYIERYWNLYEKIKLANFIKRLKYLFTGEF